MVEKNGASSIGKYLFPIYMLSHIKFQAPSSCGSLVLKQTRGVTDRKGT